MDPNQQAGGGGTIWLRALVVDDQAEMRNLLTLMLERSGLPISVTTAASGREALKRAQHDCPDVIVLDIVMPGMDGYTVCERLRADARTAMIPILMLSGLGDPGCRAEAFRVGANDYLTKPVRRLELIARVQVLVTPAADRVLDAVSRTAAAPGDSLA